MKQLGRNRSALRNVQQAREASHTDCKHLRPLYKTDVNSTIFLRTHENIMKYTMHWCGVMSTSDAGTKNRSGLCTVRECKQLRLLVSVKKLNNAGKGFIL